MSELANIEHITAEVVNAHTAVSAVRSVHAEPSVDSTGDEILRISIELSPEAAKMLKGSVPLDILVRLHDRLWEEDETRFPIIDYATTDELAAAGDDSQP
jgi:hypothetical protein